MTRGRIHSYETLAGLDGPGLRTVVFLQGCPLRCAYCHNPDTWDPDGGKLVSAGKVIERVARQRAYFGATGGVTLSGGEPLAQATFAAEILEGCRSLGIHTALDTAGWPLTADVDRVLDATDLVLLDIKDADPERHRRLTGAPAETARRFLRHIDGRHMDVWVRQVIVPGINDDEASVDALAGLLRGMSVRRVQLLGYHALGADKWRELGLDYPLDGTPELSGERLAELQRRLDAKVSGKVVVSGAV